MSRSFGWYKNDEDKQSKLLELGDKKKPFSLLSSVKRGIFE
jgi:hypothetical protein